MSEDRQAWNRTLFETLTSNQVSRNKYFTKFTNKWFKAVHRRYRTVVSLKREAGRLAAIPDSSCGISNEGEGAVVQVVFTLESPRLGYTRTVTLETYEWEWLQQQQEVQSLLQGKPLKALTG